MKPEEPTPPAGPVNIRPIAGQLPQSVAPRREVLGRRAGGESAPDQPASGGEAPPPTGPEGDSPAAAPRRKLPIAPIAPGSNRGAFMSAREIMSQRHRERTRERRRREGDLRFALIGCALLTLAFLAGFFWPATAKTARTTGPRPLPAAQREAALAKIDDAVRAKADDRLDEAATLAGEARRLDPAVRGSDLIAAEIAFRQQRSDLLRSATEEAMRRGENVSDALLLEGLDSWMSRGLKRQSSAEAIESALRRLDRAAAGDLSNPAVWFFRGEVMREGGRTREAHRSLLSALHRQQPWLGTEFLSAKLALAREEALGDNAPPAPAADLPPAAALRRALARAQDPAPALAVLAGRLTAWQSRQILDDPAFGGAAAPDPVREARTAAGVAVPVPGGEIREQASETPPTH